MSQMAGLNPWLSMWSQPRMTIRSLVHSKPTYGIFYLAAIYALQSFFFYSNWWSLGLNSHYFAILVAGILLSPLAGLVWLYYLSLIFRITGKWMGGVAPLTHIRTAIAWSKIPSTVNVLVWLVLIFSNPETVFIQDASGPSSIFVSLIAFILEIWAFVLLVQSLREVQQFSPLKSILNILLSGFLSSLFIFCLFVVFRYIYITNVA